MRPEWSIVRPIHRYKVIMKQEKLDVRMIKWDTDTMIQNYNEMMKNWDQDDQLRDRCIYKDTKLQWNKKIEINCDTDTKIQNYNEKNKKIWRWYKVTKLLWNTRKKGSNVTLTILWCQDTIQEQNLSYGYLAESLEKLRNFVWVHCALQTLISFNSPA